MALGITWGWLPTCTLHVLLLIPGAVFILLCPYSKVEESFNVQAIHDIIHHGTNISEYDHLEFSGVVPRTFLGPLVISLVSWRNPFPLIWFIRWAGVSKWAELVTARAYLGFLVGWSFAVFLSTNCVDPFGRGAYKWMVAITCTQFHFLFYISRPLPNTFALALVLLCQTALANRAYKFAIRIATFAAFVYRSELVLLFAPMFLPLLLTNKIRLQEAVKEGCSSAVISIGVSMVVDSYFWNRWLWPEGEVWWYNIVQNKSSNWGTQPFLWYFYSALPRALGCSFFLAFAGLGLDRRLWHQLGPALIFITVYSFLPHKEFRFIIYVIPMFNIAAAVTCDRIFRLRRRSLLYLLLSVACVSHLVVNAAMTSTFLYCSYWNYPGGHALAKLHQLENATDSKIRIHIDVYSAQTGISRFGHLNSKWEYNKSESLVLGSGSLLEFDYLLVGGPEMETARSLYKLTHKAIHVEDCFKTVKLQRSDSLPYIFPAVIREPCITVFKRVRKKLF